MIYGLIYFDLDLNLDLETLNITSGIVLIIEYFDFDSINYLNLNWKDSGIPLRRQPAAWSLRCSMPVSESPLDLSCSTLLVSPSFPHIPYMCVSLNEWRIEPRKVLQINFEGERLNRYSSMVIDSVRRSLNAKQEQTTEVRFFKRINV